MHKTDSLGLFSALKKYIKKHVQIDDGLGTDKGFLVVTLVSFAMLSIIVSLSIVIF